MRYFTSQEPRNLAILTGVTTLVLLVALAALLAVSLPQINFARASTEQYNELCHAHGFEPDDFIGFVHAHETSDFRIWLDNLQRDRYYFWTRKNTEWRNSGLYPLWLASSTLQTFRRPEDITLVWQFIPGLLEVLALAVTFLQLRRKATRTPSWKALWEEVYTNFFTCSHKEVTEADLQGRPISSALDWLAAGALIAGIAALAFGLLPTNSLIAGYVGCLSGLWLADCAFLSRAHPLDRKRWSRYWRGHLLGFVPAALLVAAVMARQQVTDLFVPGGPVEKPEETLIPHFTVYASACLVAVVTGLLNVWRKDASDKAEAISILARFHHEHPAGAPRTPPVATRRIGLPELLGVGMGRHGWVLAATFCGALVASNGASRLTRGWLGERQPWSWSDFGWGCVFEVLFVVAAFASFKIIGKRFLAIIAFALACTALQEPLLHWLNGPDNFSSSAMALGNVLDSLSDFALSLGSLVLAIRLVKPLWLGVAVGKAAAELAVMLIYRLSVCLYPALHVSPSGRIVFSPFWHDLVSVLITVAVFTAVLAAGLRLPWCARILKAAESPSTVGPALAASSKQPFRG